MKKKLQNRIKPVSGFGVVPRGGALFNSPQRLIKKGVGYEASREQVLVPLRRGAHPHTPEERLRRGLRLTKANILRPKYLKWGKYKSTRELNGACFLKKRAPRHTTGPCG